MNGKHPRRTRRGLIEAARKPRSPACESATAYPRGARACSASLKPRSLQSATTKRPMRRIRGAGASASLKPIDAGRALALHHYASEARAPRPHWKLDPESRWHKRLVNWHPRRVRLGLIEGCRRPARWLRSCSASEASKGASASLKLCEEAGRSSKWMSIRVTLRLGPNRS